jgi:hypothetical protein
MNKLYWIVCEEAEQTLFEGRFLGRTRGAALKHMKDQLGRSNLIGLVFSITEIPVQLIREIVEEILSGHTGGQPQVSAVTVPFVSPQSPVHRFAAFSETLETEQDVEADDDPPPSGAKPRFRSEESWQAIKDCYMQGRGPKDVAELMDIPLNTLRKRISQEGWAKQRRER